MLVDSRSRFMRKLCLALLVAAAGGCFAQWVAKANAPEARAFGAGAVVGNVFYYLGGTTVGTLNNVTCWKYDIATNTWSAIASMPNIGTGNGGVTNVDAAVIGTDIYLPGGYSGIQGTDRLLKYSTTANTWTDITSDPVPTKVWSNATVVMGGKLYILGGNQNTGVTSANCYVYNPSFPAGLRWSSIAPMSLGRRYPGAMTDGSYIYVAGGLNSSSVDLDSGERYDPISDSWQALPIMGRHRGGPGMFSIFGRPYVVGGGFSSLTATGEVLSGGAWASDASLASASRSFAHDGNARFLVKAGGWNGAYMNNTEVLDLATPAASLTMLKGSFTSGGTVANLKFSDDLRAEMKPGLIFSSADKPIQLQVDSAPVTGTPASVAVSVESQATSTGVQQVIEAFNWVSSTWVSVDTRNISTSDAALLLNLPAPYGRFFNGSGVARLRISFKSTLVVFSYPWLARLDEVTWRVNTP
jgi:hypothetical protein